MHHILLKRNALYLAQKGFYFRLTDEFISFEV